MGYEVGYGRPPKQTQFKPGQSGNPKGRPRRSVSVAALLKEILFRQVTVTDEKRGVRRKASFVEVIFQRVAQKAASGDLTALTQVLRIVNPLSHLFAKVEAEPANAEERVRKVQAQLAEIFAEVGDELEIVSPSSAQPTPRKARSLRK